MYNKICALCGKPFETQYIRSKYCRFCQAQAYRANDTNRAKIRRMEARQAEEEYLQMQKEADRKEKEEQFQKQRLQRKRQLEREADQGDLLARLTLASDLQNHYYLAEYWEAFKAYTLDRNGDRFLTVVNGIETFDPEFSEKVLQSILTEGKISVSTELIKSLKPT